VRLPAPDPGLKRRLFDEHRIEIPVLRGDDMIRVSVAAYTTPDEIDRLLAAL
jgi:selenocysteine lyase/cysteine desulfurase